MNNIKTIIETFFKKSNDYSWNCYCDSINDKTEKSWDYLVLTASNKEQAQNYKDEINDRLKKNLIPQNTKYLVVEDIEGKRVGSGGATLNVLKVIKENSKEKNCFINKKILVIHSGGDSKRVPQYSATGKLFSPVQRELPDGRASTLFDEFLITFSAIPNRMQPGILVLSGDVLLEFNPLQIDLNYLESACISIKAPSSIGCNHGVFTSDINSNVEKYLHKESEENLKKLGATNENNYVNIDTGAIYYSYPIVQKMYSLISINNEIDKNKFEEFVNDKVRLSLYEDFVYPFAKEATMEGYIKQSTENNFCRELEKCRKEIWKTFNTNTMKVIKLSPAEFIHFGTTKELLKLVTKKNREYKCLGWQKNILTNVENTLYSTNNAFIDNTSQIHQDSYIENSYIGENCIIGKETILSNVFCSNVKIPNNVCLNTVVLKNNKYVTRIYSISDNPKIQKEQDIKFLNTTLEILFNKYNIDEKTIWNSQEKNIWKANLFCECNTNEQSIQNALLLYNIIYGLEDINIVKSYFSQKRTSLEDSFNSCNIKKMKERKEIIEIKVRTDNIINLAIKKANVCEIIRLIEKSSNKEKQIEDVIQEVKKKSYEIKYRIYLAIALLLKNNKIKNYDSQNFEDLCYQEIKKMITVHNEDIKSDSFKDVVDIEMPIRVNFGGGWSDTPPFCNEYGGSVLNAAFKLNGDKPIKVHIEKINEKCIILENKELEAKSEFTNINELHNCTNLQDVFALQKAALMITGIVKKEDKSINDVINRVGSGIYFRISVENIPKGSGLGTSSILSGACIKALYNFMNINVSDEKLLYSVLEQEQLMGTGGGWQDQVGGLIPGIKYTISEPGYIQKLNIENIKISQELTDIINDRLVLIYTGQRRVAKNLLRGIMNNVIMNDEDITNKIKQIKKTAAEMKKALLNEDIDKFSELLNKHWELSKSLDNNSTNICIDLILMVCEDLIQGKMICGAGGGGFLQVILKQNVNKKELQDRINMIFQDIGIQVYSLKLC